MSNYTFIIDPGHGKDTPEKRSPVWPDGSQLFEWEFNRKITQRICANLHLQGISYYLLVPEDHDISLRERVARANAIPGNTVLISVHGNAAESPAVSGVEVFTSIGETRSDPMADILLKKLAKLG